MTVAGRRIQFPPSRRETREEIEQKNLCMPRFISEDDIEQALIAKLYEKWSETYNFETLANLLTEHIQRHRPIQVRRRIEPVFCQSSLMRESE